MKYPYFIVDVFTGQLLAGNPLAVVLKADNLSDERMQALAREFNLSETAFVRQPRLDYHAGELRIFTPFRELNFAGHPTVGAAVLLGLQQRLSAVRLEENIGLITCVMEKTGPKSGRANFSLPVLPEMVGGAPTEEEIAEVFGIAPAAIGCGALKPARYSAGLDYYLVPVADEGVLADLSIERRGWGAVFPEGSRSVYVFTRTAKGSAHDLAARMFGPRLPMGEDPATGSAAAALIGLLAQNETSDGQFSHSIRQGYEMGRPSQISVRFSREGGKLVRGGIGGEAVVLAEGTIEV